VAKPKPYIGKNDLIQDVGLAWWQFERAEAAGMLPARGHSKGWRRTQIEDVRALVPAIVEKFGAEHPIGAVRCADRLGQRLGLEVHAADIDALAEAGLLTVVEVYERKGSHNLYSPAAIDALPAEQVTPVVDARRGWTASSLSFDEACALLGWHRDELDQVARDRQLERGQFRRFARADIDALAADTVLGEQIAADRVVTADQAAQHMDVARRHFDIAVEHGWIGAKRYHDKQVGRKKWVSVPLYRIGDVDALLERPGVNWAQVRETPKGERSPLLDIVGGRAPQRAQVIRGFLRSFGAEHSIEMWGWWVNAADQWEIDWERVDGGPTVADVKAAIVKHPGMRQYQREITLHSRAGAAIRFARAMLEPGRAVILDTETTDLYGAICEIAIIEADTGKVLLDTLVNPGVPIQPGAYEVHGITDEMVTAAGVPDWATVYKRVLRATKGKTVLAYKDDYDRTCVVADCARHGIRKTRLANLEHWADVMLPRSDHAHSYRWLANGGGHRALPDVRQTRQHLLRMTAP
jgi:DNA polymerase III epsilon subunit-like protein